MAKFFKRTLQFFMLVVLLFAAYLTAGASVANGAPMEISYENKVNIINRVEDFGGLGTAFFHDGLMDKVSISENDLGVFFEKNLFEEENFSFFWIRADHICRIIRENSEGSGVVKIYFYQKALIRKYNEEALANCYLSNEKYKIKVENRISRYSESMVKWGILSFQAMKNFLTSP